jgi:hypothetical protein
VVYGLSGLAKRRIIKYSGKLATWVVFWVWKVKDDEQ